MNKLYHYAWMTGLALLTPMSAFAAEGGDHAVDGDPMALIKLEMIWAVVLFVLFAAILGFVVWPKILGALQAREQKLEGDLVGAEKAREVAEASMAEYKAKIAEAQKEAQQKVADAVKVAEQQAARIIAEAEGRAAQVNEKNKAEIAAAKDQAISEIHGTLAELSTQIAGKILKREINAADQQQLVSDSLAELSKSGV